MTSRCTSLRPGFWCLSVLRCFESGSIASHPSQKTRRVEHPSLESFLPMKLSVVNRTPGFQPGDKHRKHLLEFVMARTVQPVHAAHKTRFRSSEVQHASAVRSNEGAGQRVLFYISHGGH